VALDNKVSRLICSLFNTQNICLACNWQSYHCVSSTLRHVYAFLR